MAISVVFSSPNKIQALLNPSFGLVMIIFLAILYFYLSRNNETMKQWNNITVFPSLFLSLITIVFYFQPFKNITLRKKIKTFTNIDQEIVNQSGEFTFLCGEVKFTFYNYPFDLEYRESFENIVKIPDLLTLAAMKAHALAGRAKWKDYIDLYFILKDFYNWLEITSKAKELFQGEFNEKLFRIQLTYFEDINYTEQVEFMPGFEVSDEVIKKALVEFSLER